MEPERDYRVDQTPDAPEGRRLITPEEWVQQRWGWLESVRRDKSAGAMGRLLAHELALGWTNVKTLRCDPSERDLAAALDTSVDTIKRAISALIDAGWIVKSAGRGRGVNSQFGFLTTAKVVALRPHATREKGGNSASLKGGNSARFSGADKGAEKGADLRGKGGKFAYPYIKDKPCKNHGRAGARARGLSEIAEFWIAQIQNGKHVPETALTETIKSEIQSSGLLTAAQMTTHGIKG